MLKNKVAQSSLEFMILLGVALVVLIIFTIINITYLNISLREREITNAQDLAKLIKNELNLASRVESGYIRKVTLPVNLDKKNYGINIGSREVFVYFESGDTQGFSESLATNVVGFNSGIITSSNKVLTIRKCSDSSESVKVNALC